MDISIKDIENHANNVPGVQAIRGKGEVITGFSTSHNPKSCTITWVKTVEKLKALLQLEPQEMCIVAPNDAKAYVIKTPYEINNTWIFCENPKRTFFFLLETFFRPFDFKKNPRGENSVILSRNIGDDVCIGCNCFISEDAEIADRVIIGNNVSIEGKVQIGERSIIHSGTVIGTDGYGYYTGEDGIQEKVVHYGGVVIGKNVEVGANTCIDRGTLEDTLIGDNVKIDNLCHIAHNCNIEKDVMVIALSMLGGSSVLKRGSYVAPGSSIMNQVQLGENSMVGMGSVVIKNVEDNSVVAGVPAKLIRNK